MIRYMLSILVAVFFWQATIKAQSGNFNYMTAPLPIPANAEEAARISNDHIQLSFVKCGTGNKAIACRMEVKIKGKWCPFMSSMEDNKVFVLSANGNMDKPDFKFFFPSWKAVDTLSMNPYLAGNISEAIPVKAVNEGKDVIRVDYATRGNHTVTGYWRLPGNASHVELYIKFTPVQEGCYSLGVQALHALLPANINNVLLPPLFQYKRIPETPQMLVSSMMQQPLAIVETSFNGGKVSAFVSGDDTTFPNDWGGVDYSPMGFAIKNHSNTVQPTAFSPVMGMKDSKLSAGQSIERKFIIGFTGKGWNETLEYISENVYHVRDYRRQEELSLTETMFNIIDLMRDPGYGGWDSKMKGFYDIEGKPTKAPTVVHAAPLAIIGAAVTAHDEDLYISHALPTIEYTLSRKGYRWSTQTTGEGYNKDIETLRFAPFESQFTTSYFEGLYRLLGKKNPWLRDVALPGGSLRTARGYSFPTLSWVQALYAYRMTGDEKWLRTAQQTARRDIDMHIYTNSMKPVRYTGFYNTAMYGAWWDLIDLYETTGQREYLDAARYGAAHTIAGIRNYPAVRDTVQTIHEGNKYNGNTTMWWKGSEKYRLGFPRSAGDAPEHDVPAWKVSPVGLGFEQPSTYFLRAKGKLVRPVFMSSWAPHFLRLNQHTGIKTFETYARNAVIGRFSNYPGYYATGYTDITMNREFPYKGPDVSSIYYHHIPPHLAFTADYLVSEAIQRSEGRISFPYGKQEGFVWFSNRIFGGEAGTVFDDTEAHLWMKRGLIESSNPSINYVTAISGSRFWIILSGENSVNANTTIHLSEEIVRILPDGGITVYDANGKKQSIKIDGNTLEAEIPAKGFRAFALPVSEGNSPFYGTASIPVLKEGMKTADSGTDAGRIYAYRIRSPFGWDSVFGFCETPPAEGLTVEIDCNGDTRTVSTYPFEWSIIKFKPEDTIHMKIHIKDSKGNEFDKTITFN